MRGAIVLLAVIFSAHWASAWALTESAPLSGPIIAQSGETTFDGDWSGTMYTTRGNRCSKSYPFQLQISGGTISGRMEGNVSNYRLSGKILPDRTTQDMKAVGSQVVVDYEGTFEGDTASGDWRSDSNCRGTFRAKRKQGG